MSNLPPPPPKHTRIQGVTQVPEAAQEDVPLSRDVWEGTAAPRAPRARLWEPTWGKLRLLMLVGAALLLFTLFQPWTITGASRVAVRTPPCGTWDIKTGARPSLVTPADIRLQGVAALAPDNVWASGYRVERNSKLPQTLIAHWTGGQLDFLPSPSPDFTSVGTNRPRVELPAMVALAPNDVWAIGGSTFGTLTLHWNGSQWQQVASPNAGSSGYITSLLGAAATASDDVWAAGYSDDRHNPLILHWNGSAWQISYNQDVPSPGIDNLLLAGITALSRDNAWAVGSSDQSTLIMHWDGTSWQPVPSPNPCQGFHVLNGIAGVAANDVWAVGGCKDVPNLTPQTPYVPLMLHWDGTAWQPVSLPVPAGAVNVMLTGVVARAADDVWALGRADNGSVLFHWDGTAWTGHRVPVADPARPPTFHGLSLTPAGLWAAGAAAPADAPTDTGLLAQFTPAACPP